MKKSIVWPILAATSLALTGCGGGDPAEDAKPPAAAKKKGEKEVVSPWAKDAAPGSEPAAAPKKKDAGKEKGEVSNPWAKETPKPSAS